MSGIFECSVRTASIPAGGVYNIAFSCGASPAVFQSRTVGFNGASGMANVYEAPTGVTGGTTQAIFPMDLYFGAVPQGVMTAGVTITGTGTKRAATSYYRGTTGNGQTSVGTFATIGGMRRLKNNTTYLLQFTNDDAEAQVIDIYFRWYEGGDATPGG